MMDALDTWVGASPERWLMGSLGPRVIVAVVDDDEAVRDSTRLLLELCGFEACCYESGDRLLSDDPGRFEFLLIDYQLPGMTGFDIVIRLRQQGHRAPAAIMTGSASPDVRRRASELGVAEVFSKPLDEDELISAIRSTAIRT